jgi:hypothetical protein
MTIELFFGTLLALTGVYLLIGLFFAIPFVIKGAGACDSAAHKAKLPFRLVILPGVAALWVLLLPKWRAAARGEGVLGAVETPVSPTALRARHVALIWALAIIGPILFAVALVWRAPRWQETPTAPATDLLKREL